MAVRKRVIMEWNMCTIGYPPQAYTESNSDPVRSYCLNAYLILAVKDRLRCWM